MNHLRARIDELVSGQPGTVAVALQDLATGDTLFIKADVEMHAASTMKVPVMIEVFRQAREGRFSLDDSILVENRFRSIVDDSEFSLDLAEDSDESLYATLGMKVAIRDLVHKMITASSNLATNVLIDLVDADAVQKNNTRLGAGGMKVLRGVEDIKAYRQGLSNTTTARAYLNLLVALAESRAGHPDDCRAMIHILGDQQFGEKIPALLPEGVRVAHKTGHITRIDHDGGIVYPQGRPPYALVLLSEGFEDTKQCREVLAGISQTIYDTLTR